MTDKKLRIELSGVQETLILPLWARARETEKEEPLVKDFYAKDILSRIDYDFSKIEKGQTANHQLIWPIRAYNFDICLRRFLNDIENVIVVNIGAGLDTTFRRIDNGSLLWINLDLPDVADIRQQLIPDSEREKTIAKSVFDFTWIDDVAKIRQDRPLLLMAAGILCYFTEDENRSLFCKLAEVYPMSHFIFDAMSRFAVKSTNWAIMKKSGMDAIARLKWHLNHAARLNKWIDTLKVIEEYSMFAGIHPGKDWDKKTILDYRIMMFLRMQNMYKMIHVQF